VKQYLLYRNPYAKIKKAWLDFDEFGYKAWYLDDYGEENGSYLVTNTIEVAIQKMKETLTRPIVIISVRGGVVQDVETPPDIGYEVIDYDDLEAE